MQKYTKMNHLQRKQFERLLEEFDRRCVRCGLRGYHLDRDHIKPKYKGGSEHINNIQPLCAWCNASKSQEQTNWKHFRRVNWWATSEIELKLPRSHPFNKFPEEHKYNTACSPTFR